MSPQINGVVTVSGQSRRSNQFRADTGLKEFAIPFPVSGSHKTTGIYSANDLGDVSLDDLKSLPVTACGQCVATLPVGVMMVRVPVARLHTLNQPIRNVVPFDRQGVVGIASIDLVDEPHIGVFVWRQGQAASERR